MSNSYRETHMSNKKIKVLVIGSSDRQGGAAEVGWNVGKGLIRDGVDVKYFVAYKTSESKFVDQLKKPSILEWFDIHTRYHVTALYRQILTYFFANDIDFGASQKILNHPWYKEADVIHLHNIHGNFFKLETLIEINKEKKIVWTLHDMWAITGKCVYTEDPGKWKDGYHTCSRLGSQPAMLWNNTKYLWNKKKDIYSKLSNLVVVSPSRWLYKIVGKSILKNARRQLIYNGVDINIFKPSLKKNLRQKLGLPNDKQIILFAAQAGATDPRKGWKYAEKVIEVYKDNKNVIFLCIGGGKQKTEVKNLRFVPYIKDATKLAEYYSASDVLLLTSLAENCSLVVLEAMACGLPVVGFDAGGTKELVVHKINGYIAKYKDFNDLVDGVRWVLSLKPKKLLALRKQNVNRVKTKYTVSKMTEQYMKLYRSLESI